jgi:hypothetical protein
MNAKNHCLGQLQTFKHHNIEETKILEFVIEY